ncbi:MAG: V-type ATPase subunit subunit G family protein [bacterium]
MTDHHARPEDNPLQLIAQKERELEIALDRVRREAAGLVEAARRDSEATLAQARKEAAALVADSAARAEREAQEIAAEVVGRARGEADALGTRAEEGMAAAVRLVVDRVVGGAA